MILVTDVTPLTVKIEGASRIVLSCVAWIIVAGPTTPWVEARVVRVRRRVRVVRCIVRFRLGGGGVEVVEV